MPTKSAHLILQFLHADPFIPNADTLANLSVNDWDALTDDAIRYRVPQQIIEFVTADTERRVFMPETCLLKLEAAVRKHLMHNLWQQVNLREMLHACAAEGLPVILMKVLWLVEYVYRDASARVSADIRVVSSVKPNNFNDF